ncbi:hypothetical protein CHELA20_52514 [Hyphomicrobiales bacterium]|nr:hypothetical protein CHELA41_22411 [Hyphomicrobiales bacterium]CAH1682101.1 hypothetical protein CHELA20_52514 [Hyphomicrobiales bacterium]
MRGQDAHFGRTLTVCPHPVPLTGQVGCCRLGILVEPNTATAGLGGEGTPLSSGLVPAIALLSIDPRTDGTGKARFH